MKKNNDKGAEIATKAAEPKRKADAYAFLADLPAQQDSLFDISVATNKGHFYLRLEIKFKLLTVSLLLDIYRDEQTGRLRMKRSARLGSGKGRLAGKNLAWAPAKIELANLTSSLYKRDQDVCGNVICISSSDPTASSEGPVWSRSITVNGEEASA